MGLKDVATDMFGTVRGIFSNNTLPEPTDEAINTEDEDKLVKMVEYDYNVFREKRQGIEEMWRREQRIWASDHWTGLRPPDNGPYPERMEYTGNYAWSQIESIVARLTGWTPEPDFEPQEEGDEAKANLLNAFIPYELNQIKFKPKHIRAVRRMVIHGPLVYKTIHDPTVKGGRGNNRYTGQNDIIPLNFGAFFPDPAVKDFIDLQKGRAHIINLFTTISYVRERWPKQGVKVMPDNRSSETEIFDRDGSSYDSSAYRSEDNQTTTNVLEYWYKGKPKYLSDEDKKLFKEMATEAISDVDPVTGQPKQRMDPSIFEAKAKGQMEGIHCIYVTTSRVFLEHKSYVYDHGQYPIVARSLFPEENNPWGKGYMRDLISPQTMYNRFMELAIEITAKMGNSVIVYGTTAGLTEAFKQIWKRFRSKAGAMLPVQGDVNQVKELQGVPPNPGIFQYIQHLLEMMQKIPGMFDSSNGAANSDVTSGEQAKALISASQGRLGLPSELIEDAVKEVIEQYIALCAQFYKSERVARITGKNVSFSSDAIMKRAPTEFETGNQVPHPETGQMVPEVLNVEEEYVPGFDIKVNIGVEKPKDREYYIQMAFNLLKTIDPLTQMPMIDAQAVKYTVENGRMEPMSVIEERMQVAQQQIQKMQQLQQENGVLNEQVTQLHDMLNQSEQGNAQGTADTLKQLNEGQRMDHEQQMKQQEFAHRQQTDMANTQINAAKVAQMGQRQPVGGGTR